MNKISYGKQKFLNYIENESKEAWWIRWLEFETLFWPIFTPALTVAKICHKILLRQNPKHFCDLSLPKSKRS